MNEHISVRTIETECNADRNLVSHYFFFCLTQQKIKKVNKIGSNILSFIVKLIIKNLLAGINL